MRKKTFINYALIMLIGFSLGLAACSRVFSGDEGKRVSRTIENAMATENATHKNGLTEEELRVRRSPVVDAVEKVGPAVVNISTEKIVQQRVNPFGMFHNDEMFDQFFDNFFERFPTRNFKQQTLGSGVIIDPRGYILTNEHVILRASEITVTLPDESVYKAQVIGADPKFDLAILKIEAVKKLPSAKTGDSDTLMIGETVIAIGNPFGLGHTITSGVLSGTGRSIKTGEGKVFNDFIQTDASINPGNSGGPLLDLMGEIIGINTAIYQDAQGIGFAIPINRAMRAVSELIRFGEIKKTWTGMRVQPVDEKIARHLKLDSAAGVLVADVLENTPAEKAGIVSGDVVLSVNGKNITTVEDFNDRMSSLLAGDKAQLRISRDGKEKNISMTMEAAPLKRADEIGRGRFGFAVADISKAAIRKYGLRSDSGVIVTAVDRKSPAAEIGIAAGDLIRQIGSMEIKDMKDYREAVIQAAEQESVFMVVQRGAYLYNIRL